MAEIDLLKNYPKVKRRINERATTKTPLIRRVARKFGKDFFDGERKYGYGGFAYHPRFWQEVVKDFQDYYHLSQNSSVLDVGCAKGFMLYDFKNLIPGIKVAGIDISAYAIKHARGEVKSYLKVANAKKLPYPDESFDLVVSINTVHNLPIKECKKAIKEIMRVCRKHAFITVDAYRNEKERKRMQDWNLTALTYMSVSEWKKLFAEVGYKGDYWWFIP